MTVAQMREGMSNAEYVEWQVHLGRKAQRQQLAEQRAKRGKGK